MMSPEGHHHLARIFSLYKGGAMETVLVIESDRAKLVALALILRCFGHSVLEADSRGEAWRVCHQFQGPIHLVITNAILENHRASEFVARLQLVCPQMRALFVGDTSPAELAEMACEFAFLPKPFEVDTLAYTIKGLLQGPKKRAAASVS
jgi:DNA-binding NtrC family response regulator